MSTAITVKQPYTYPQEVLVQVIEDDYIEWCNHANAVTEEVDFGTPAIDSRGDLDYFDDWRPTLVCNDCNKLFNELDQEWQEA